MVRKISALVKRLGIVLLMAVLGIIILPHLTAAQGSVTQLEYRIRQLETEVSNLRGQISQLRYQSPSSNSNPGEMPQNPNAALPSPRMLSGDPMFDRLATMVIELKQDVIAMEARLSQLESPKP